MSLRSIRLAVVILVVAAGGCSESTTPSVDGGGGSDAGVADAGGGDFDADLDAATTPMIDSGPGLPDSGPGTDAGPPPEPCTTPGETGTVACGMCGTQTRFCTMARVWEYAPCMGETGECVAGSADSVSCGMCGTQARRCNATCSWELFGACTGESGECAPSTSDRTGTGCAAGETRVRRCDTTCAWSPYSPCAGTPTDFDGDGDPYGTDCDDTNPAVHVGSVVACGSFACAGTPMTMGVAGATGTRTCLGPGYTLCARPATCIDPPDAFCDMGMYGREARECATTGTECVDRASRGQQTRRCTRRMDGTYGWTAWTACPATSTPPASCSMHPSTVCGACGEGLSYSVCDPYCNVVTSPCLGGGCTPGTTRRSIEDCAAGEFRETGCDLSCTPTAATMCMPFVPAVDVMLLVDVTGSHTALVTAAADALGTEIAGALAADMDVRVGVSVFGDFPHGGYGGGGDVPFRGLVPPTTDTVLVTDTLRMLPFMGGGDGPESGVEALNVLADGTPHPDSDPFTCPVGTSGGGCWRPGAQRVVIVITDISQHNVPHPALAGGALVGPYTGFMPLPVVWADTRREMIATGTRLFAIVPDGSPFGGDENQPAPQFALMTTDLGQDPAASMSVYAAGTTDISAAARDIAAKIAAYTGVTP